MNVTVKSEKDEAYKIKEFMRKTGQERIREQVALYIKQLKEGSIVRLFYQVLYARQTEMLVNYSKSSDMTYMLVLHFCNSRVQ